MNDLQIVNLEQMDIAMWNFEQLKGELSKALSLYETMVYTDETIKTAKNNKATLAKAKKLIEDKRKEYKARCLAPYEALEPQMKELVSMIEEQRVLIDDVVKDYTERQKQEKEATVRTYYNKKAFVLGELADALYGKILNPKWLNASTAKSKYEEEMQTAINQALQDIHDIKAMESPFITTLLETYVDTLSIEKVKEKQEELVAVTQKAGFSQTSESVVTTSVDVKQKITSDTLQGVTVKIYGNTNQMNQIYDFMKAIGVNYEIQ